MTPGRSARIGLLCAACLLALPAVQLGRAPAAVAATDPIVSIGDASVTEGTSVARNATFTVSLSAPATSTVTVQYRIVAGSASAGSDVDTAKGQVRTLTFARTSSGVTPVAKTISVKVLPDSVDEPNETFTVVLSNPVNAVRGRDTGTGTIVDDDPIGNGFRASVSDQSIVEGNAGVRKVTFTVSLSQPAGATVGLDYSVQPLSASAGTDIVVPKPKRLTFTRAASGFTPVTKSFTVSVAPDVLGEGDETFAVVLANPSVGILLADATGIGRIIDDEPARRPLAGAAVRWPTLGQQSGYAAIAGRRFDIITPENEMKWDAIEPQRGQFNFVPADAIVDFADARGEAVHGHALAWHSQNPTWLTNGGFSRDALVGILTNHIHVVVGHYRGRVGLWDVVNEPIGDDAQPRPTIWSQGIGPDSTDLAFRAARAADPAAKLYVNEYGIEGPGPKADALYALVSGLVARGVPIDGVGFQTHVTPGAITTAGLASQFARYAALGLAVSITELDVRIPVPATATALSAQAATYAVARDACVTAPNCATFTTWGFTDAYSWIPGFLPGQGAALPWDEFLNPKPAYTSIVPLLRN